MKIAVLSIYPFPNGMAATNRITAYSKGLVENDAEVEVITIHPTEPPFNGSSSEKLPDRGEYNGIKYVHPSGRYRNKYKILRAIAILTKFRFWRGVVSVAKILKSEKFDAVIMSFDDPFTLYIYSKIIKYFKGKTIFIFDEYPIPIRHKLRNDIPLWKKKAYKFILKSIDGYISISKTLAEYYSQFSQKKYIIIPVIVNNQKFRPRHNDKENWITYIGNMEPTKDNIGNIAKAFIKIANSFPEYSLHFFGPQNNYAIKEINSIREQSNLMDRIIIEGQIDSDKVPDIINKSKLMVSSQPNTMRAQGGFPTKLGEYVVMGVPTLICDVGENSKYITNEDCYFVEPDNIESYASQMKYILNNYEDALKVARHGRDTIITKYSSISAGRRIIKFINSLTNE